MDFLDKLEFLLDNFQEITVQRFTEKAKPIIKKMVEDSIAHFYSYPEGKLYKRTNSLEKIQIDVIPFKDGIKLLWDDDGIGFHKSFNGKSGVDSEFIYNFAFDNGEHGHGIYNIGFSEPAPHKYFQKLWESDTKISECIAETVDEILNEL